MDIQEIPTPAILVDHSLLKRNITKMSKKARKTDVSLRPHIKTHKCIEIGELQRKEGTEGITVATLSEARAFMKHDFDDITYAVPLSFDKVEIAIDLNKTATLNVLVDNPFILEKISEEAEKIQKEINILVKVDCGYHRCGVDPSHPSSVKLVEKITNLNWLNFKGILTHAGHSYYATSFLEIQEVAIQEQREMVQFAEKLEETNSALAPETVSIGSTPTITVSEDIPNVITEVRPGSYVYFDYTLVKLGVCRIDQCSFSVLSSILGKYSDSLVIDAGATALSKDVGPTHVEPDCGFGRIYSDFKSGTLDSASTITGLSQEHGKVEFDKGSVLSSLSVNEKLRILPNHSCLTNNLFDEIYVVEGEKVVDKWKIHRGHHYSDRGNY